MREVSTPEPRSAAPADEPPPFLTRWRNVYLAVVAELVLLIVAFYLLARWAS